MEAVRPATEGPPPAHVAIIMDGNGRWAKSRGLPRTFGHQRGAEAVRRTVEGAVELGIGYVTLFGFSSENWKRSASEIDDLMGLLRYYLAREVDYLHDNGVRLRVIGDRRRFAADIVGMIDKAETRTRGNGRLNLIVALGYGGRAEIVEAARRLAEEAVEGRLRPQDIDEAAFSARLYTADIPDPDLMIRTSGEQRISNFLLWQAAYTELVFLDRLWPDFDKAALEDAIREYRRRDRRYGAVR